MSLYVGESSLLDIGILFKSGRFELKPKLNAMISISRMRLSPQNLSKVGRATVQVLN